MNKGLAQLISNMPTASFSVVMATGIVSIACDLLDLPLLSRSLLWLNVVIYAVLVLQLTLRVALFFPKIITELSDHKQSFGFFTLVAGTAVLGNQCVLLLDSPRLAMGLWIAATLLWLLLTYVIFTCITVKAQKPSLSDGIHGGWLVSVVAAQAVSSLGSLLSAAFVAQAEFLLFFSLVSWLAGGMLYIWIISLIFYRYSFFVMPPDHLTPPYWINMGAMAISTLAGTLLIDGAPRFGLLAELLPFIKGMTLLFWATATWWIPMLVLLGIWRHILRKVPISYDPVYWSMVFPLGMYTAATYRLASVLDLPYLAAIPRVTVFAALGSWALTALGLIAVLRRACCAEKPI